MPTILGRPFTLEKCVCFLGSPFPSFAYRFYSNFLDSYDTYKYKCVLYICGNEDQRVIGRWFGGVANTLCHCVSG